MVAHLGELTDGVAAVVTVELTGGVAVVDAGKLPLPTETQGSCTWSSQMRSPWSLPDDQRVSRR